jgi:integrase
VLERISALFTFAVDQDWIEANPAWRIKKPGQERTRDRVLTRDELRELWPALHEIDAFLVMLLTAQRCGEVCQIEPPQRPLRAQGRTIWASPTSRVVRRRQSVLRISGDRLRR